IWMITADSSEETNISTNTDPNLSLNCPLWSPDGKRIAYLSETKPLADGEKVRSLRITEQGKSETIFQADSFLRLIGWSESGYEIIVGLVEENSKYTAVAKYVNLFRITVEGGKSAIAHLESAYPYNIQLSPNKRTIAFVSDRDGMDNVWVIPT